MVGPAAVFRYRCARAARVGRFLFLAAGLGAGFCADAMEKACRAFSEGMHPACGTAWGMAALWWGLLMGIALLDARSRFQDYKRAKDLFFENGPHPRVARLFAHSKCQRDAALAAARDLGMAGELKRFYRQCGYGWYHLLPDAVFKHPRLFFRRRYWQRTLFAPFYNSSYFLW